MEEQIGKNPKVFFEKVLKKIFKIFLLNIIHGRIKNKSNNLNGKRRQNRTINRRFTRKMLPLN